MRDLSLLIGIILTAVIFSFVGNDDLNMSFGAKSTAFKERNLILHTSLVHIHSCLYVVKGICNDSSAFEKLIAKDFFSFFTNLVKPGDDMPLKARIEL